MLDHLDFKKFYKDLILDIQELLQLEKQLKMLKEIWKLAIRIIHMMMMMLDQHLLKPQVQTLFLDPHKLEEILLKMALDLDKIILIQTT